MGQVDEREPSETGILLVEGEDNCVLGYFSGEYTDVLAYAKTLKGWSQGGSGGRVTFINVVKIDSNSIAVKLQNRLEELETEMQSIQMQLAHKKG